MSVFYSAVHTLVTPAVMAYLRPRVTGRENVPSEGPFLVASNHLALVDSFIIPVIAPRQVRFIAKDEYWKRKGPIGWVQKKFFDLVGTVPVDRDTLGSQQGALKVALDVLREGDGFGIYPEGTRSRDGRLYKGRPGAAWLAVEAGCPVIPVGLKGTDRLFEKGRVLPPRRVVTVRFGEPLDFSDLEASLPAGARRRQITARMMDAIAELSGQERAESLSDRPSPETGRV